MCMTFVVGKNVSKTGRVLIGHNEDDSGHTIVRHGYVPPKDWPDGATIPAEDGCACIPQAKHTFGYHWSELAGPAGGYPWGDSFLNECGVCVTSNNCNGSKEDHPDLTDGGIAYNLRRVLAERSGSAREGLMVMIDMVETWGYAPSGRCYFVADKDEAFMMQIVNGKHYVAARVPDDHVVVMPNHYTFRWLDEYEEMYCSAELVDYAFDRGWYDPARDGRFDFSKVYQAEHNWRNPLNMFRHVQSLSALTGRKWDAEKDGLPCSIQYKGKLGVKDLMALLSNHYEGTADDLRIGPGRAPHDTANCRVCSADTSESFVCDFHEDARLTTFWTAFGRPCETPYIPLHPLMGLPEELKTIPDPEKAMAEHLLPNPHLADYRDTVWQKFRDFANMTDMVYSQKISEIAKVKKQLLAEFDFGNQESLMDPETIVQADALRVRRAAEAFAAIELPTAEVITQQPVKTSRGETLTIRFSAPVKPEMESLRLGACRMRMHAGQYAVAANMEDLGGGVYEAQFNPDPMLDYTAKGVHESFLGGADAAGNPFVAMLMIDSDAEPLPST